MYSTTALTLDFFLIKKHVGRYHSITSNQQHFGGELYDMKEKEMSDVHFNIDMRCPITTSYSCQYEHGDGGSLMPTFQ